MIPLWSATSKASLTKAEGSFLKAETNINGLEKAGAVFENESSIDLLAKAGGWFI